jgi:hypothetical protein
MKLRPFQIATFEVRVAAEEKNFAQVAEKD